MLRCKDRLLGCSIIRHKGDVFGVLGHNVDNTAGRVNPKTRLLACVGSVQQTGRLKRYQRPNIFRTAVLTDSEKKRSSVEFRS
jgi:hypothetical protein